MVSEKWNSYQRIDGEEVVLARQLNDTEFIPIQIGDDEGIMMGSRNCWVLQHYDGDYSIVSNEGFSKRYKEI
jgi:hypothetical protein